MAVPTDTDQVTRTPVEQTKKAFDRGTAIFVDVRPQEAYLEAHIPGAQNIPVSGPVESYYKLPRDRDIIL